MFHALIDIGSNTVRLALYQIMNGQAEMVLKKKNALGLAACIDNNSVSEVGVNMLMDVLRDYRRFLDSFSITRVDGFATAALRSAENGKAIIQQIKQEIGFDIRILSGEEEATYDFIGATHGQESRDGVLIDVGGASTEVIVFYDNVIAHKVSLPMGSLSLHRMYCRDILPTTEEIGEVIREAKDIVEHEPALAFLHSAEITGIGGTMKGAAALYSQLYGKPEENASGGIPMNAKRLPDMITRYLKDRVQGEEDLAKYFRAAADRLHTLLPGLAIVEAITEHFGADTLVYSDSGVREGFIHGEILK
ncbi:MAG: exopolyphosphatase [Selenomonadaceae bacterium]|nr:exopolyphosphatase [Selenomonadaceae bacterium]